jgi:hypothetical protein
MKKLVLPLFSCLLVLSLLLGLTGSAKAAPGDDPTVTPVSGDTDFMTEVVAIASLPGTVELAGGMLVPVGFSDGEAQFGGNGILVTGFDSGKATACFNLSAAEINQGWGGKVAVWDGAKWVRLATTITTPDETNTAIACATITGSGTYAFIKYVVDPSLLPYDPICTFTAETFFWDYSEGTDDYMFNLFFPVALPIGTPVSWHVVSYADDGSIYGNLDGSWTVQWSGYYLDMFLYTDLGDDFDYATIDFQFPTCHLVHTFENGMFTPGSD